MKRILPAAGRVRAIARPPAVDTETLLRWILAALAFLAVVMAPARASGAAGPSVVTQPSPQAEPALRTHG